MYCYSVSAGNPEGLDFVVDLLHEKKFTESEFQDICESAFVYALEKENKKRGYAFLSSIDDNYLFEYLKSKGFKLINYEQRYFLEPYWGKRSIKSKELLKWVNREDDDI